MNIIRSYIEKLKIKRDIKRKNKLYNSYGSITYDVDPRLGVLDIYLEEIGVRNFDNITDQHHFLITFNDGTKAKIWNNNRWDAWMSAGYIEFSNGESIDWTFRMPSKKTLYKFKKYVEGIENDYTKYLPISYIRKNKLKKLNNNS